jgi:HAD superfamily hydrolase (TIGR01509 family)
VVKGLRRSCFSGPVVTGRGEAAGFTRLEWVRAGLLRELGIDPYPGTLNLLLDTDDDRARWAALQARPGVRIDPPDAEFCGARLYPVRVEGIIPAAIVLPDVPGYPAPQVEIVAALSVREMFGIADGDRVAVEASEPVEVRAVIFDVDGTLVDSLTAFRIVAERAAAPYGVSITDAAVREALNTTRSFWDVALPGDHADRAAAIDALTRKAARLWPAVLSEYGRVFPDAGHVLRTLRDRGARLGIVTGSRRRSLEAIRDAGWLDVFDAVVTGEQVQRRKPDPEGLLACAAALRIDPCDAVYVGDTPLDIRAARAAGMFAVGVLTGAGDAPLLSASGPDRLIASLARLLEVVTVGS